MMARSNHSLPLKSLVQRIFTPQIFIPRSRKGALAMLARARIVVAVAVMLAVPSLLPAQDKGLARTPPMGWNSWNKFGCNVSEDLIRQMADAMAKSGMKDAGYQYVVIDDCWQVPRSFPRSQVWHLF
jgi:hypothetical protein